MVVFVVFKLKRCYVVPLSLVGAEMCIGARADAVPSLSGKGEGGGFLGGRG